MRPTTAFSLGVLACAGLFAVYAAARPVLGGDGPPPPGSTSGAAETPPTAPVKEAPISSAFLKSLVGEWGCDCAFPTGGHASGTGSGKLVMDGTALMTETTLDWTVGDKKDRGWNLAIWKTAADGKSVNYWGFSSHDATADMLSGEVGESSVTVSGTTKWGPMRLTLSTKDGVLSEQLWIDKHDMGTITYKKK